VNYSTYALVETLETYLRTSFCCFRKVQKCCLALTHCTLFIAT